MLLFCHGVAFGLPLQACVCVREGPRAGENTCECFCASRECMRGVTEREKGDNYIILWIRGVRRVIEAPLADGCTCNPAVMRQRRDHTPHTLSPIMYIINATACGKKKYIKKRYSPLWVHFPLPVLISSINADAAIKSQKSEVSADSSPRRKSGRAMIFDTGTLREIIFETFHRHKKRAFFISFCLENRTQDGGSVRVKTAVALLFLFILQETTGISFRRRQEEICSFMAGKKSQCRVWRRVK